MIDVSITEPDKANLLCLMMANMLKDNVNKKVDELYTVKNKGNFCIVGTKMEVYLSISLGKIIISPKRPEKIDSTIKTNLNVLLDIASGRGFIKPFLTGKIKIKGNPFKLLALLKLFK